MKIKGLLILGLGSVFILTTNVDAVTDTSQNTATFSLTENTAGLSVEAENLDFGTHEGMLGEVKAIAKNNISVKTAEYSGNRTGWNLYVKLDKFIDSTSGKEIKGASLFYPKVTPINTEGVVSSDAPTSKGSDASFLNNLLGTVVTQNDAAGNGVPIANAPLGKGYGNWEFQYKEDNRVQLKIPANQQVGDYTAKVTYTIIDTP